MAVAIGAGWFSFLVEHPAVNRSPPITAQRATPRQRARPAPSGAIIALDAAIRSSGNLTIGAQQVIGNSISVGGSLSGSATVAAAAPAAAPSAPPPSEANKAVDQGQKAAAAGQKDARDPNSILTVELVGLGEESTAAGCEEDDEDERCKERATRAN